MRDIDWDVLLGGLRRQNCILLLGPDLSGSAAPGAEPVPDLRQELADRLAAGVPGAEGLGLGLSQAAQRFQAQEGRNTLEQEVARFFRTRATVTSRLHEDLAALPLYLVMTSCHDDMMANAFVARGRPPISARYSFQGDLETTVSMGTVEKPLVYSLYGHPTDESSLVLTEADLLDFLVAVVSKNPPLPDNLRSELQHKRKSFLFLGFGIKHWHLRILLHVLRMSQSDTRSFALEASLPVASPEFDQSVLFYKTGYKIEILSADVGAFVRELRERYEAAPSRPTPSVAAAAPPLPPARVFICHAKEDRARALELHACLVEAKMDPWMDERSLQPGDRWDQEIERRIRETDYVVVLQSRSLAAKTFSYVNKEINLALEQQRHARAGISFVIPLQIEDCEPLAELQDFQTLPCRTHTDEQLLVSAIRRDQQRRARA